jgi:opacity protein-like surface antigen
MLINKNESAMKPFLKYFISTVFGCLLITVAQGQIFYSPFGYPQNYNNHYYHNNNSNQNEYQTYSFTNGRHPFILSLNYSVAVPFGSLKNYVSEVSPRGWNVSGMYTINNSWSAGITSGYNDFYQKIPRQVYHLSGSDISAVQTHTIQTIPVLANGMYAFHTKSILHPYAGLGIGATNITYEKWWGEFEDRSNSWAFTISPEAGIKIPFGKSTYDGLNIGVKYSYMPYAHEEINNINYLEANAGVYFHLH